MNSGVDNLFNYSINITYLYWSVFSYFISFFFGQAPRASEKSMPHSVGRDEGARPYTSKAVQII